MFIILRNIAIGVLVVWLLGHSYENFKNSEFRKRNWPTEEEKLAKVQEVEKPAVWVGLAVVSEVIDGDTVAVKTEQYPRVVVRLAGIDAPELPRTKKDDGQPLAKESRDFLGDKLKDKAVNMSIMTVDTYKRPVVLLTVDDELVNAMPVREGLAEVYEEWDGCLNSKEKRILRNAQQEAKEKKLGIWGMPSYQRPSEYRIRYPAAPAR